MEKEIVGINDFATNIGYVIGPILAGFLAPHLGTVLELADDIADWKEDRFLYKYTHLISTTLSRLSAITGRWSQPIDNDKEFFLAMVITKSLEDELRLVRDYVSATQASAHLSASSKTGDLFITLKDRLEKQVEEIRTFRALCESKMSREERHPNVLKHLLREPDIGAALSDLQGDLNIIDLCRW